MIPYTIQNILVPMDLSETSLNALQTAVSLAKKNRANIYLLFVEEHVANLAESTLEPLLSKEANMDVLMALAGAVKQRDDILPHVIEETGNAVECIVKNALKVDADLVVMGTHGASGFRDGFIGSTTYGVIKYSNCPVLTIPSRKKFTTFKKVLFPIKPISGAFLPYDIASHFLATNSLINVLGLSYLNISRETAVLDKIVEEFRDRHEAEKVNIQTSWSLGTSVANDILQFAQQNNPDLIVLTPVLDAVPKQNFVGPNAQKVINGSKVPVLHIKKMGVQVSSRLV